MISKTDTISMLVCAFSAGVHDDDKIPFFLVLLGVRNFLRQYCEEKLNFSWKSDQNALCKVFYVNLVTIKIFLFANVRETRCVSTDQCDWSRRIWSCSCWHMKVRSFATTFILAEELLT